MYHLKDLMLNIYIYFNTILHYQILKFKVKNFCDSHMVVKSIAVRWVWRSHIRANIVKKRPFRIRYESILHLQLRIRERTKFNKEGGTSGGNHFTRRGIKELILGKIIYKAPGSVQPSTLKEYLLEFCFSILLHQSE